MPVVQPNAGELGRIASSIRGLRLLVLHGSRHDGHAHERSDWDFAYRADKGFDAMELQAALVTAIGTDRIDLADLDRAGGLLPYRVARDGEAIYERHPDEFKDFCYVAILFWLDAGDVIEAENAAILERLG